MMSKLRTRCQQDFMTGETGSATAEDFAQQIGDARGGVRADLALLLTDHVEQAVERLADDVAVEVEGLDVEKGDLLRAAEQLLVLARHSGLAHRAVHDRRERR